VEGVPERKTSLTTTTVFHHHHHHPSGVENDSITNNNTMAKNPFDDGEHKSEECAPPLKDTPTYNTESITTTSTPSRSMPLPEQSPTRSSGSSSRSRRRLSIMTTTAAALTPLSDVENNLLNRLNHQYNELERPRRIRSSDVPPLRREYESMRKQLRAFLQAARRYKEATKQMAKAKETVRVWDNTCVCFCGCGSLMVSCFMNGCSNR